jgi:hypothetical protein
MPRPTINSKLSTTEKISVVGNFELIVVYGVELTECRWQGSGVDLKVGCGGKLQSKARWRVNSYPKNILVT